ncbi:MAG: glycoside hydrolase family 13 protein, partial [Firmicutes bacterium]|nr:glycoside hydrolase family 13 protein [Bacillota bacterium]
MYVRRESCSRGEEDQQWLVIGVDQGITKDEEGTEIRSWAFSFTPEREGLYFYHFIGEQDAEDHTGARSILEQTADHQLTVYKREYETPDWLKKGLMYQIFPDRFCRSEEYTAPEIKNKKYSIHESWGELPVKGPDENGIVWNNDFFGGNLKGIVEKLAYLEELGVTVIYLNPIFEAFSNHRYDTANYMKIDPMLGVDEDLRTLCEEAKKRGMRVILDGVFNHTGSHSIYFNQDGAYDTVGAAQSKDSPYYKWYQFKAYPDDYESWWGIKTLPNVNEDEPTYLDYILRDKDSVVKHWLSYGISGYRLDVADELPDIFLDEIRKQVKSVDPDACVLGEVWEDASNKIAYDQRRRYFHGDQLDSVMNYPLKDELIAFLLKHGDGKHFMNEICSLWENYPPQNFFALMNLLGTHDTVRIYTVMLNG